MQEVAQPGFEPTWVCFIAHALHTRAALTLAVSRNLAEDSYSVKLCLLPAG